MSTVKDYETMNIVKMICERYESIARRHGLLAKIGERKDRVMDLMSADKQFDIDWLGLFEADDYQFIHDVDGLHKHVNRSTYPATFEGGFLPRFAK